MFRIMWGFPMPMMWGAFGPWGGVAPFVGLLVWALVLAAVVYVVRLFWGRPSGRGAEDALGVLAARYARGEISKEEFERVRRDLRDAGM